jgi:hypothetical protein
MNYWPLCSSGLGTRHHYKFPHSLIRKPDRIPFCCLYWPELLGHPGPTDIQGKKRTSDMVITPAAESEDRGFKFRHDFRCSCMYLHISQCSFVTLICHCVYLSEINVKKGSMLFLRSKICRKSGCQLGSDEVDIFR